MVYKGDSLMDLTLGVPLDAVPGAGGAQKMTKKQRQKKGEYMRKLEDENKKLKREIQELRQKICTLDAQNACLEKQLVFFQGYSGPGVEHEEPERAEGGASDQGEDERGQGDGDVSGA